MPRRVTLPGASELFRPTTDAAGSAPADDRPLDAGATPPPPGTGGTTDAAPPEGRHPSGADAEAPAAPGPGAPHPRHAASEESDELRPTGRVRHDEKITVYVSSTELLALEQLRLTLRAEHGLAADRGRIVRAAIAEALADVHARGAESALVRRLSG